MIGDERSYTTDWLTTKTLDSIDSHLQKRPNEPFCSMVSYPDPHPPLECREPYESMFRPEEMAVPQTFTEENLPDWAEEARSHGPLALDKPDREATLRRRMAEYFGEVKLLDDCLGKIVAGLDELGILDDTIVVYTTDHGEYMGEHGLREKNELYETAYRTPLLIRWPAAE